MNNPVLEDITFIDTPGVLSGEKQRIGRSYEFTAVTEWFAERADMILLLFDAHKLDISDEFRRAIESLRGNDDKIRVVLNKSDMVTNQQLMRVYGAMMWSLGKVLQTPEVVRVYISSFPFDDAKGAPGEYASSGEDNYGLFDKEKEDLLADLYALPKYAAIRKVNELVKRARLAKTHSYVLGVLKEKMPSMFGKKKKQEELIVGLKEIFFEVHKRWNCPVGDFPNIRRMQERLKHCDFGKFPKLNEKMIRQMDDVLSNDIPKLMKQFPQEQSTPSNPYASANPFEGGDDEDFSSPASISHDDRLRWADTFNGLNPGAEGKISGGKARPVMVESGLPKEVLSKVWTLSDNDKDGSLNLDEFIVCMWLMRFIGQGNEIPRTWEEIPAAVRNVPEEQVTPLSEDFQGDPFGGPSFGDDATATAPPMSTHDLLGGSAAGGSAFGAQDPWPEA
jgi:hypothetical protein